MVLLRYLQPKDGLPDLKYVHITCMQVLKISGMLKSSNIFNLNNFYANDFQPENFPIYVTYIRLVTWDHHAKYPLDEAHAGSQSL